MKMKSEFNFWLGVCCVVATFFLCTSSVGATLGVDWTALTPGTDTGIKFGTNNYAYSVAYGSGKFVAVGAYGKASYSSDGITWTALTPGTDTGIKFGTTNWAFSVAYGSDKFVAVGSGGVASYSSDGITWTSFNAGYSGTDTTGIKFGTSGAESVTYGLDKFVAVGTFGKASYSSDGITWTALAPGTDTGIKFGTETARSVAYGLDKFVAVGTSGNASYSSDGITWTSLAPGTDTGIKFGASGRAYSVAYGLDKFVAVGDDGRASYSSDGITWTALPAGTDTGIKFGANYAFSVAYGSDKFVAVGSGGVASYSSDGITWTSFNAGYSGTDTTGIKFGTSEALSVAYGLDKFVVVGSSGMASYSSLPPPNTAPNSPTSPTQLKADASTNIANQGSTNETNVNLRASATDPDTTEVINLFFEVVPNTSSFTASDTPTTATSCATGTTDADCASKVWYVTSDSGDYSTTPFTGTTNVAGLTDADYKWQVKACDDDSACSDWVAFNVTAPNFTVDTTLPIVAMTAPADSAAVSGSSVTISADASDNVAVVGVQFKLDDNTFIGSEVTTPPYSITWNSNDVADGTHTFIAVARDSSDNYATSSAISFNVKNHSSSGGFSVFNQVQNLLTMGNKSMADELMKKYPNLFPVTVKPIVTPNVGFTAFTHSWSLGQTGNEVKQIQQYLNTHGFVIAKAGNGSVGHETNYFGYATKAALIKFQKANNILPATGDFGPRTRALLNNRSTMTLTPTLTPPVAQSSTAGTGSSSFIRDLEKGMTGEDVKQLQVYLNTHGYLVAISGYGSLGHETMIFGLGTKSALIKFQKAKGISPAVGYFGPLTRKYISTH